MPQKYPEGAIIVRGEEKRKVIGVSGDTRFLSTTDDFEVYGKTVSVKDLDWLNVSLEETPWVPKDGESYWFLDECGEIAVAINVNYLAQKKQIAYGNCFKRKEEAQAAAERVRKAFKGEK